jgi:hypothetical protein
MESKVVIYLALDESDKVIYDLFYSFDFRHLKKLKLGSSLENIDFTQACEEFIGVSNNGEVAIFSIKKPDMVTNYGKLIRHEETPVTKIECVGNPLKLVIFYSESNYNLTIIRKGAKMSITNVLDTFKR